MFTALIKLDILLFSNVNFGNFNVSVLVCFVGPNKSHIRPVDYGNYHEWANPGEDLCSDKSSNHVSSD